MAVLLFNLKSARLANNISCTRNASLSFSVSDKTRDIIPLVLASHNIADYHPAIFKPASFMPTASLSGRETYF